MKKETKQLIFLLVLLSGGLIYAYSTYLFTPEWTKVQSLAEQVSVRKSRYEHLVAYQDNISSLQAEIKSLQLQSAEFTARIPITIDKPGLLVSLYTVAKANKVEPQAVSFEPLKSQDTYLAQPIIFVCSGESQNVLTMIKKLQTEGTQRFTIESVNLTNQLGVLRAELKLMTYASNTRVPTGEEKKLSLLNSPIGLESIPKMFKP